MEQVQELIASVKELIELQRQTLNRSIEPNRCYTTEEAAIALRVSPTTIHRMIKAGLAYRSIKEKGYIFTGRDIMDFLDTQIEQYKEEEGT